MRDVQAETNYWPAGLPTQAAPHTRCALTSNGDVLGSLLAHLSQYISGRKNIQARAALLKLKVTSWDSSAGASSGSQPGWLQGEIERGPGRERGRRIDPVQGEIKIRPSAPAGKLGACLPALHHRLSGTTMVVVLAGWLDREEREKGTEGAD